MSVRALIREVPGQDGIFTVQSIHPRRPVGEQKRDIRHHLELAGLRLLGWNRESLPEGAMYARPLAVAQIGRD